MFEWADPWPAWGSAMVGWALIVLCFDALAAWGRSTTSVVEDGERD